MKNSLVSVIVGVYNKERFVGECLRSVLSQTYTNWELIVVDDASTDGSWNVIQEAARTDARVRVLKRSQNSGLCGVARNDGARASRGEILMFLDADDLWISRKMEVQVAFMEQNPGYRLCHARCWKVDSDGRVLQVRHESGLPESGNYRRALLERMWVSISTVACRRDLWDKVGGFTEESEWGGEEDAEFFLRCAKETDFGTIQEPLAKYRISAGNWSSKKWKGVGRDYMSFRHIYDHPALWQGAMRRREMRHLLADVAVEGCQYWRARGDFGKAAWFARRAVRWSPLCAAPWRQVVGVALRRR